MMQMSDARVLGRLADAVILVFRAGETTRDSARAARQRFAEDGTPVLGTILNSFDPKAGRHYGYYSGYYNHYYGRDRKDG
jgi:Mrp family chromosome partitioning ATPase